MPVFSFPDDAQWNEERRAVEFTVEIGEYRGTVAVPRAVFQSLLPVSPTPEACLQAFHLDRLRFERIVEQKIRRRELAEDGNLLLSLNDFRQY